MKLNQQGTVNNGQHGVIIAVYTHGGVFRADNGVEYTVLDREFVADDAPAKERRGHAIRRAVREDIEHPVTHRDDLDRAFNRLAAEGFGADHVTGIPQGFGGASC